jgi:hypothetical protein
MFLLEGNQHFKLKGMFSRLYASATAQFRFACHHRNEDMASQPEV